jgi:hypothetical protein
VTPVWVIVSALCGLYLAFEWARWAYARGYSRGMVAGNTIGAAYAAVMTSYLVLRRVSEGSELEGEERPKALVAVRAAFDDGKTCSEWLAEATLEEMADYVSDKMKVK